MLSRTTKIGYGTAELGVNGVEVLVRVSLLIFYTDVVGLAPHLAGYAIALGVVWDAITDPLIGRFSDATHSPWGKRRPYILLGAILLAPAIVWLFSPPQADSQTFKFLVLLLTYICVNTAMTVIAVPHAAQAGDLTEDPDERAELFAWRMFFANVGLLVGVALPGILVARSAGGEDVSLRAAADVQTSYWLALLVVLCALVTVLATRNERQVPDRYARTRARGQSALVSVLRNKAFWPLFAAYVTATLGLSINTTLALYYYRYRLLLEEADVRLIIGVFMLVFCASLPFWVWVAKRYERRTALFTGVICLGLMTCVVYPLFEPGNVRGPLLAAVLGGVFVGAVVLLEAALADVVDYDQLKVGYARFGLYFGIWKMGAKASRAFAIGIAGNVLAWIGFVPNEVQSPEVAWRLALAFGPGVGVFLIAGAVLALAHPLTREKHARIRRLVARRERLRNVGVC